MTPIIKRILLVAALVILAAALVVFLRPQPLKVETSVVTRRRIETSVDSEAKTRIHDRYVISAPVSGRLLRVGVEEGDRVNVRERIASIDPLPMNADVTVAVEKLRELDAQMSGVETLRPKAETLAQAQTRIAQSVATAASIRERVRTAQLALDQARRDTERDVALERQGYASKQTREQSESTLRLREREFEIAKSAASAADAQVAIDRAASEELAKKTHDPDYLRTVYEAQARAIRAQLQTLEDQRARTSVTAPASGQVLHVYQKSESYVAAGMPLIEIGSRHTLEIVADVLSADVVDIRPGNPVVVTSGVGTARITGVVRRIEPSGFTKISALGIEEQRVNVLIDLKDPPPRLGDGYRLDVRIITSSADALAVPIAALFRCGADWCAYIIRDGRTKRVTVAIGRKGSDEAEVLGGLSQGDTVVMYPSASIRDGTRVR